MHNLHNIFYSRIVLISNLVVKFVCIHDGSSDNFWSSVHWKILNDHTKLNIERVMQRSAEKQIYLLYSNRFFETLFIPSKDAHAMNGLSWRNVLPVWNIVSTDSVQKNLEDSSLSDLTIFLYPRL